MDQQTQLLRQFVDLCKKNPSILHEPNFAFYREYLESLGASIPPAKNNAPEESEKEKQKETEKPVVESSESEQEEDVMEVPPLELDMSGVIEGDHDEPLPMGDSTREIKRFDDTRQLQLSQTWVIEPETKFISVQVTDEDIENGNEERDKALGFLAEGNYENAVEHFTKAIEANPGSAILHAKRANALLKLNKPNAAIYDCNKAISLNPDSAQGYKFRGRAFRLLGKFSEAHQDFALALKLDYDETTNEWFKEIRSNVKKIAERDRAAARLKEEREIKKRQNELKKRKKEHEKAAEANKNTGMPGGFPAADFLSDPEIQTLLQDQEVIQAYLDIVQNPNNMMKYVNNPKVMKAMEKLGDLKNMFKGGADGPADASKESTETNQSKEAPSFTKVPEPDLD